jgi:ATP-dependent RNA helicase DeaD
MDSNFKKLGIDDRLLASINDLGFELPSPIQEQAIPMALQGVDIVGLSQTGSGKTAAFSLPMLQKIDLEFKSPQALVLCPTRELAVQVAEEIQRLATHLEHFYATPIYGGAPIDRQIKALKKGVHVVVGTPGRIIDHLKRKTLKLDAISMVILDEADRMLDMGFRDEMEEILDSLPEDRQTLFFSATMNKSVTNLIKTYSRDAKTLNIKTSTVTVESIDQSYYEVRNRSKIEVLSRLLDMQFNSKGIIFCNTKQMVEEVAETLTYRGYMADRIHGDINQSTREKVIKRFREGKIELLVATDVAARGLDIDDIEYVFNYDLPYDPEDYVHRIGRTARAGRSGKSITFVFGRDIHRLEAIQRYTKQSVKRLKIPTQEDVEGAKADTLLEKVREVLESGKYENYDTVFDRLLDAGNTPSDIMSALFHLIKGDKARELQAITEDNEVFGKQPRSYQEGARPKKKRFGRRRFSRGGERSDRGERSDSKDDHKKKSKRISRFAKNRKKQS